MKYHVRIAVPSAAGPEIDAKGGPGPILKGLLERFQPEAVYSVLGERALILILDLATPLDLAVLMST